MSVELNDPGLLREAILIDGVWGPADTGATIDVGNPANGALLASVPKARLAGTVRAISAASKAMLACFVVRQTCRLPVRLQHHCIVLVEQALTHPAEAV